MGETKLKRYHEYKERGSDVSMFEEPDGEWVRWEDVKILLSDMVEKLGIILDNFNNDNEHLNEVIRKIMEN